MRIQVLLLVTMILCLSGTGQYRAFIVAGLVALAIGNKLALMLMVRDRLGLNLLWRTPLVFYLLMFLWALVVGVVGIYPLSSTLLALKMVCTLLVTTVLASGVEPSRWFALYALGVSTVSLPISLGMIELNRLYSNSNQLGQQAMCAILLSLGIFNRPKMRATKVILWLVTALPLAGALFVSRSRASILGSACGLFVALIISTGKVTGKLLERMLRIAGAVALVLFPVAWLTVDSRLLFGPETTGRSHLWQQTLSAIRGQPLVGLVGVGLGNAGSVLTIAGVPSYPHNLFLNALLELGIPGLILTIGLFNRLLKAGSVGNSAVLVALLTGLFLQQFFEATLLRLDPAFLVLVITTLVTARSNPLKQQDLRPKPSRPVPARHEVGG